MPRKATNTPDEIVENAMRLIWSNGYHATSMDQLVEAIGASRHAIYSAFGSKQDLYLRCFDAYQRQVVTPAFGDVENGSAGIEAIENYFETQISLAEDIGLPGFGCLVANAATETAPHDQLVAAKVDIHHRRLKSGFCRALSVARPELPADQQHALAEFLVTFAQGLWSMSRTVSSAAPLRGQAETIISYVKAEISR